MILDLDHCADDQSVSCDVCVIGAGAVGIPIAVDLAQRGKRVVLLESGGVSLETRAQDLMHGDSVGHPFKNLAMGRYRVLGGATTFWGGGVIPLRSHVFGARPWIGDGDWPFGCDALQPYFRKTFAMLGLEEAEFDDAAVWRNMGQTAPNLADDIELLLIRILPQRNFAKAFRQPLERSPGLTVYVHANVHNFDVSESGLVTNVAARSWSGRTLRVAAKHVVIAAGAIESARLMLSTGASAPWGGNPWLGRGFLDHLDAFAGDVFIRDYAAFHNIFDSLYYRGHRYFPKMHLRDEVQQEQELVDIAAQFIYDTAYAEHLANIKMFMHSLLDGRAPAEWWKLPQHVISVAGIAAPLALRYIKEHRSFKPRDARVRLQLYCEQLPHSESQIRLSEKKDALGMPRVEVDWKIDGREIRTCALFAKRIKASLESAGIASVDLYPDLANERARYMDMFVDSIHQMSTARMGRTAKDGVVDSDLRVHGTRNLYVAGTAAFPSAGFANPTMTGISLGLRLCDHLAGQP